MTAGTEGVDPGDVIVTWDANPASDQVDHYNVYRSNTPGVNPVPGNLVASVSVGINFYIDTGLTDGTYYYVVTAVNAAGEGPASEEDPATLP